MGRKRKVELERAIETALAPGVFIGYRDSWDFVERLEAVRAKIAPLIQAGEPGEARRAVALLETFIGGCYEKPGEIDDSSGSFGQLAGDLFCDWIRGRQAAGADPDETAGALLSWMENDDYGYCLHLEKEAVKLHAAMALRIVGAKKSKYYDAALGNLEKARKLLLREGQAGAWEALAAEIRSEHRRKSGFMPGFERVAEGRLLREPSFAERARRRWRRGAGVGRRRS